MVNLYLTYVDLHVFILIYLEIRLRQVLAVLTFNRWMIKVKFQYGKAQAGISTDDMES